MRVSAGSTGVGPNQQFEMTGVGALGSKLHYTLCLIQNKRALGLEIKVNRVSGRTQ